MTFIFTNICKSSLIYFTFVPQLKHKAIIMNNNNNSKETYSETLTLRLTPSMRQKIKRVVSYVNGTLGLNKSEQDIIRDALANNHQYKNIDHLTKHLEQAK